jgi:hypothetical protein
MAEISKYTRLSKFGDTKNQLGSLAWHCGILRTKELEHSMAAKSSASTSGWPSSRIHRRLEKVEGSIRRV